MPKSIEEQLAILENDLRRKSTDTQSTYKCIAKKFLGESGDFSRFGMMKWLDECGYGDNSLRSAYYVLKRLCKALEVKFPLDSDDLAPIPDEDTIFTPTMLPADVRTLIRFWKQIPGKYNTSLAFISTVFGTRADEMTDIELKKSSLIVTVAKRKAHVTREHDIPEEYLKYISGYVPMSESSVRYKFWQVTRYAEVKRVDGQNWHSIRRALGTAFKDARIDEALYKRFMRWAPDRENMASVYTHHPFNEINGILLGQRLDYPEGDKPPKMIEHPFLKEWR